MKQINQRPNAYLHESIKNIDKLSKKVREYLQIDSKQHTLHVLHRQQEVVVIVESPILAGQLKYEQKAILQHLNQTLLCEYKTIKIKLSPPQMVIKQKHKVARELPLNLTKLLDQVRSDLESD